MKVIKSVLLLALAGVLFTGCKKEGEATAPNGSKTIATTGKVETARFKIDGMSCAVMCAGKIQKELSAMKGVQKATVDFDKKSAAVEYNSALLTPNELVAKVESIADGKTYKVSALKSTADHAMLLGDPKEKSDKEKGKKKAKKDAKCAKEKKGKDGCCAAKKSCHKTS